MSTGLISDAMFSLKLPAPLYSRLSRFAERERRSRAFIVRDALEAYLASHENTHKTGNNTGSSGASKEVGP